MLSLFLDYYDCHKSNIIDIFFFITYFITSDRKIINETPLKLPCIQIFGKYLVAIKTMKDKIISTREQMDFSFKKNEKGVLFNQLFENFLKKRIKFFILLLVIFSQQKKQLQVSSFAMWTSQRLRKSSNVWHIYDVIFSRFLAQFKFPKSKHKIACNIN